MRYTLLLAALLLAGTAWGQAPGSTTPAQTIDSVSKQMPEFPGGQQAMASFLQENLQYPKAARRANKQGTVVVETIIKADGSVTNPRVISRLGRGLDEEALRLVAMMPPWVPGKLNGKEVNVRMTIPIKFRLN